MFHHDMDISRLMVYAQQIEETKLNEMNKEEKRARPDEQGQPRYKKRFYNQDSPMVNNDRVSNPNSQGGKGSGSSFERSICAKCGKQHLGRETNQASHDGLDPNAPKKNRFYVLQANKDKGAHSDEGTMVVKITWAQGEAKQLGQATASRPRPSPRLVVLTTDRGRSRGLDHRSLEVSWSSLRPLRAWHGGKAH
uniref:Gag-pol polyprotein n=1 Tax=Solanum tuberosum TaxID=4113 RepID=M1DIJ9_SOLTU